MRHRRRLGRGATVLLALAAAGACLALGAATWVTASVPDPLTTAAQPLVVTGTEAAPLVPALALVAAAAAIAMSTSRGLLLLSAAAVLTLAGAGATAATVAVLLDPASVLATAAESAAGTTSAAPTDVTTGWAPPATLVPALVLVLAGTWSSVVGRRWTASARFERDVRDLPPPERSSGRDRTTGQGRVADREPAAGQGHLTGRGDDPAPQHGSDDAPSAPDGAQPWSSPTDPEGGRAAPPRLWDELSGGQDPTR